MIRPGTLLEAGTDQRNVPRHPYATDPLAELFVGEADDDTIEAVLTITGP